jgi:hypothetical protein
LWSEHYPIHLNFKNSNNLSLKGANNITLLGACLANIAVYLGLFFGDAALFSAALENFPKWTAMIPASSILLVVGVLNALLSATCKAQLVFTRYSNPLPGCRAFSELAKTDARIDLASLKASIGKFPVAPKKQNALWYSVYRTMEDEPSVRQAHRSYLLARDYAVFALFFLIILGPLSFLQFPSSTIALSYTGLLIVQLLLAGRAARVNGIRFVTTVLARKSAEPLEK